METLWKNNFNSVTKAYDMQHADFIIVVNIVSKGGEGEEEKYYCRIDLRNITQYFASRTRVPDHDV